ncbi:hypothetical protein DFO55_11867 [Grimontella sp. AG753]|nr:hypothetical protein DFO55_11867 [Grimontella sp. AG753]
MGTPRDRLERFLPVAAMAKGYSVGECSGLIIIIVNRGNVASSWIALWQLKQENVRSLCLLTDIPHVPKTRITSTGLLNGYYH